MEDRIMTPEEVADYLRLAVRTIYALLKRGELRGIKIGRVWRIPLSEVQAYVDRNLTGKE